MPRLSSSSSTPELLVGRSIWAALTPLVLGKTNLTMMHNWYNPGIPSGWSPLGGQVVSAFGPDLPVRGGSAGNAVAVSAGWCAFAVGTESCGGLVSRESDHELNV